MFTSILTGFAAASVIKDIKYEGNQKQINMQVKYSTIIHCNHPDARDPVYDALTVDVIILLVSEYKSYSSGGSVSFSGTYKKSFLENP
jgi:hypothetical protein